MMRDGEGDEDSENKEDGDAGADEEDSCLSPWQVFRVEVLCNGRRHTVTKRYSEFQALHKRVRPPQLCREGTQDSSSVACSDSPPTLPQIKKTCKVPDFPPRHVPNWMPKVLEQRRQGLEVYLQVGSVWQVQGGFLGARNT